MVRKLIQWSLDNPLFAILMAVGLAIVGVYSFLNINVEAYPDPAPPTVEIVALFPGASAEEVEKQVTIPLEVALAGMPGSASMHTKTVFGLSDIKILFNYGVEYKDARQEAINRLQSTAAVAARRYAADFPRVAHGRDLPLLAAGAKGRADRNIYTLNDLKALQDWVLEREFRSVPRVVDVTSWGGTVRRYEVQPDPDRMRRYGITLAQLQSALANSNATVGGDYVKQGDVAMTVRSVGLFGGGEDPVRKVLGNDRPRAGRPSAAQRGRTPLAGNPRSRHHFRQQPTGPRGRRGRRRAIGPRQARRRPGRRRVPSDPPGEHGPLPGEARRRLRIRV